MEKVTFKKDEMEMLEYILNNPYLEIECQDCKGVIEKVLSSFKNGEEKIVEVDINEKVKKYLISDIEKRKKTLEKRRYILKDVMSSVESYTKNYGISMVQFIANMLKPWWDHNDHRHSMYIYVYRKNVDYYPYYKKYLDVKEGDLILIDLPENWYFNWLSEEQRSFVESSVNPPEQIARIILEKVWVNNINNIEDYFEKIVKFAEPPYEPKRVIFSCCKGVAPVSVPLYWLNGFNPDISFGYDPEEETAYIRFPNGKAYYVVPIYKGRRTDVSVGRVTFPDSVKWGPLCRPWEYWSIASIFGVSNNIEQLDYKFDYDYGEKGLDWWMMRDEDRLGISMKILEENIEKYKTITNVDQLLMNYEILKKLIDKGIKENWKEIIEVLRNLYETLKPLWEVWNYTLSPYDNPSKIYFRISDALWSIAYKNKFG